MTVSLKEHANLSNNKTNNAVKLDRLTQICKQQMKAKASYAGYTSVDLINMVIKA